MPNSEVIRTFSSASFTFRAVRPAFAAVMAVMMICTGSQLARALPAYAKRTGLPCRQCHVDPAGGGTLSLSGDASRPMATGCRKATVHALIVRVMGRARRLWPRRRWAWNDARLRAAIRPGHDGTRDDGSAWERQLAKAQVDLDGGRGRLALPPSSS